MSCYITVLKYISRKDITLIFHIFSLGNDLKTCKYTLFFYFCCYMFLLVSVPVFQILTGKLLYFSMIYIILHVCNIFPYKICMCEYFVKNANTKKGKYRLQYMRIIKYYVHFLISFILGYL